MDDLDNLNDKSSSSKLYRTYFAKYFDEVGPSSGKAQVNSDLRNINKTFDDCRMVERNDDLGKESTLIWNPQNKCFEVRHIYIPRIKEKNFRRDDNLHKIFNEQQPKPVHKTMSKRKLNLFPIHDQNQRDEYFQKIINKKEHLLRTLLTAAKSTSKHNYPDSKFKAKYKKYRAVTFNPEVQVIYMIKKKSNNEVHLRGVEVLNKEQDQQMRNFIMRTTYSKKKTLLY